MDINQLSDADLLHLAMHSSDGGDRADSLLEYATRYPDDTVWKQILHHALDTSASTDNCGYYLNTLTLFPNSGLEFQNRVLVLTNNDNPDVRAWAIEVLVMWVRDCHFSPQNPDEWRSIMKLRLDDNSPDFKVRDQIIEDVVWILDQIT